MRSVQVQQNQTAPDESNDVPHPALHFGRLTESAINADASNHPGTGLVIHPNYMCGIASATASHLRDDKSDCEMVDQGPRPATLVAADQFRISEFRLRMPAVQRVALFSGNYNYVKDGANQALNRLSEFLDKAGVTVRIYSPTVVKPEFEGYGEIVSVPSFPLPFGRGEYRLGVGLSARLQRDLDAFKPDIIHVSCPDIVGHAAIRYARRNRIPVAASVHTRFETYPRYYGMKWLEPAVEGLLRRFYGRCDKVLVPSESMALIMRAQLAPNGLRQTRGGSNGRIDIWARGVDHDRFSPTMRCCEFRSRMGFEASDVVVGFCGRLVLEKGLDVLADSLDFLTQMRVPHRVLIIGEGPARKWFQSRLPCAVFTGFLTGEALAKAMASMDVFFNPSVTETFGNVTLEAMASGLPVVAANAPGSQSLIAQGADGRLVQPGDINQFASALAEYCSDIGLRHGHGLAARDSASNYRWDFINGKVLDCYFELITAQIRSPLTKIQRYRASVAREVDYGYAGLLQTSSTAENSGPHNDNK